MRGRRSLRTEKHSDLKSGKSGNSTHWWMGQIRTSDWLPHGSEGAECSKQPYRNGTTVLGNLTPLLGVPDDADREARITLTPSINAAALDPVPARLTVFSAWVRWEALPVVEAVLVEPPEVHEPLFVVVVVPVVARLPARWANRTLDNSITMENERIFFSQHLHFGSSTEPLGRRAAELRLR